MTPFASKLLRYQLRHWSLIGIPRVSQNVAETLWSWIHPRMYSRKWKAWYIHSTMHAEQTLMLDACKQKTDKVANIYVSLLCEITSISSWHGNTLFNKFISFYYLSLSGLEECSISESAPCVSQQALIYIALSCKVQTLYAVTHIGKSTHKVISWFNLWDVTDVFYRDQKTHLFWDSV